MRFLRKLLKLIVYILLLPVFYVIISLILTAITVNEDIVSANVDNQIYISTNGVHLDIIIPADKMDIKLYKGLNIKNETYLSFGWGDEDFYLNTPTWSDLSFKNAFNAMFLDSNTLIHLTRYKQKGSDWTVVNLNNNQLKTLNEYILNSFKLNDNDSKIILEGKGYYYNDDFYKANGSYSCINTCNSWVNSALKQSNLKSCYWTSFDFGVLNKYKE